ncbi:MAG: hydrogenase maturation nickel metallochaperone HypA [Deltaproteobacteria bacterium]|nr:hydrogenase maturation nickel metallochaperone HypA [Candidatus Zymogenaceae bacterium]
MHEMSLVESLMVIIEEYAEKQEFEKVLSLRLTFGRMNHIEPHALTMAFEALSRGTRAQGAELEFTILPVEIKCADCGRESEVDRFSYTECPLCGGSAVVIVGGTEELRLIDMMVE